MGAPPVSNCVSGNGRWVWQRVKGQAPPGRKGLLGFYVAAEFGVREEGE